MIIDRKDIIKLIYGQGPVQRFTQDSPVLPDVWIAYAANPDDPQDLLLTPYQSSRANVPEPETSSATASLSVTPGLLAREVEDKLRRERRSQRSRRLYGNRHPAPEIAYNLSTVAVRLRFDELVRVVLPISRWWWKRVCTIPEDNEMGKLQNVRVRRRIADLLAGTAAGSGRIPPDVLWTIQVVGTLALARETEAQTADQVWIFPEDLDDGERRNYFRKVVDALARLLKGVSTGNQQPASLVYMVSLNRSAAITMWRSTQAVKADAATRLFHLNCSDLTWAIIDSGIDAKHPAFRRRLPDGTAPKKAFEKTKGQAAFQNHTRVLGTYDFTLVRHLLSTDPEAEKLLPPAIRRKLKAMPDRRKALRASLISGREIDWTLIAPFIQVPHDDTYAAPANEHGTHVAGILAADWRVQDNANDFPAEQDIQGVCPDINVLDLRVLDQEGKGDEFTVMAALQFVRYLNLHREIMVVHGVNVSLSIPHDVLNYACGRTPVCEECERLVGAGIVVVAAAGNEGYQKLMSPLLQGNFQQISITDPGNAEGVITVGSTHRDSPHTYGVSYFSSRGPTGDGRCKPDVVAPGEKIESSVPGDLIKRLDGTSMAAPHVSGGAALLLARHRELMGRPQRIKQILCETATDLGRERYFQGSGMLDVLRALQSV